MPAINRDLHGNAPDKSRVALLLIDVINDLEFPEGDQLLRHALPMGRRIAELRVRARSEKIPIVYVNDNFGKWRSDLMAQVDHCLKDGVRGQPAVELLKPGEDDYFVLKPKHSGFFSTTLDILLEYLGTQTVILTGLAANICVLFTANDAYMRDLRLVVPGDCVASNTEQENAYALEQMRKVLKADIRPSSELPRLAELGR
jgi:nicotinamidase-related amidase